MRKDEFPIIDAYVNLVLKDIKAEIKLVKAIVNEEIIEHDRKDLINYVNGINQCLCIIDKHISGKGEGV